MSLEWALGIIFVFAGILAGIGGSLMASPADFSAARVAFSAAFIFLIAFVLLSFFLIEDVNRVRFWKPLLLAYFMGFGIVGAGWIGTLSWVQHREAKARADEPYKFKVRTTVIRTTDNNGQDISAMPLMIGETLSEGYTVYPLDIVLKLDIVNMQNVQSKIASYYVDAALTSDGPWKRLIPLTTEGRQIYVLDAARDLTKALEITFLGKELSVVFQNQSLQPHDSITAWALFQNPEFTQNTMRFFQFHISDTAGIEANSIVPIPANTPSKAGEVNTQEPLGFKGIQPRDISNFKRK